LSSLIMAMKDVHRARNTRFRRLFSIEMESDCGNYISVVANNISSRGIAILGETCLQPGDLTILRVSTEHEFHATVVWRKGRRLGLRFESEVSLIQLLGFQLSVRSLRQSPSSTDAHGCEL
jgi:hypothetical protein